LKDRGVSADIVSNMAYEELAMFLASHRVKYEQDRLPLFVKLRHCLMGTVVEVSVSGSLRVGDLAITADTLYKLVVEDLTSSKCFRSIAWHDVTRDDCTIRARKRSRLKQQRRYL
jgi:hypothetical protein